MEFNLEGLFYIKVIMLRSNVKYVHGLIFFFFLTCRYRLTVYICPSFALIFIVSFHTWPHVRHNIL